MRFAALPFFALCLLAPSGASAAKVCPWVTQGSVDAVLGGDSTAAVTVSPSGEGVCSFRLDQGGSTTTLRVTVGRAVEGSCPAGSPTLEGIGNEATVCTLRRSHSEVVETIFSRVREKHFTVSITIRRKSSQPPEVGHFEDAMKQIAEQVAGNLF
jgi:hypothetical protein